MASDISRLGFIDNCEHGMLQDKDHVSALQNGAAGERACRLLLVIFALHATAHAQLVAEQTTRGADWVNELHGMLTRSCMYGFGIKSLKSTYDADMKDRKWRVECGQIGQIPAIDESCIWTYDFMNAPQMSLTFNCPPQTYLSGIYSDYNATANDRIWRLECCSNADVSLTSCADSDWINELGGLLELHLPDNQVLHGVFSEYHNHGTFVDRRWKFSTCHIRGA